MVQVGGTWKYVSAYFDVGTLTGFPAHATYTASVRGNVQLVVSHGCPGEEEREGAWCSPGFWRNADDSAWELIGVSKDAKFNQTVVPDFYLNPSGLDPTLGDVLHHQGSANHYGAAAPPYNLNAFNATGAYLTDQIPGFKFDPAKIGTENACPLDNKDN
jgi:hypothetical protein